MYGLEGTNLSRPGNLSWQALYQGDARDGLHCFGLPFRRGIGRRNSEAVSHAQNGRYSGGRVVSVTTQKTKKQYAEFMKALAASYPDAKKIVLVQDNLNTHNPSSFYEVFSAAEAFALTQRFEMVYTPKKASWLNMAEIELSALSKQCLDRRIAQRRTLAQQVGSWTRRRNRLKTSISWNFTKNDARKKLSRFYDTINN